MAKKIADLSLEELYNRDKKTPATVKAIQQKENFSVIKSRYCESVCKLCVKAYDKAKMVKPIEQHDVVVIYDYMAEGKDRQQNKNILDEIFTKYFATIPRKTLAVLKCPPTPEALGSAKTLTQSTALRCSPYLLAEIDMCKPKVIVCMSTLGLKALGFKASIFNERGEIYYYKNIPVVVTLHPKYLRMIRQVSSGKMWGTDYYGVVARDVKKARKLYDGSLTIPDLDSSIEQAKKYIFICRSLKEVEKKVQFLQDNYRDKVISFDLETTSLDPWASNAKILTAQFGYWNPDIGHYESFVVPLWHRENDKYDSQAAFNIIIPLFKSQFRKTGHNLKFDVLYTYVTTGIRVENIAFDTMLHLHDINSGIQKNYGLKRAVWDFLPGSGLGGYEDKLPKLTS